MDSSGNIVHQEETSKFEYQEIEAMASEWTDEKHCLFLKSMESTFVNQLYRSIEMFGLQSHKSISKSLKQKQTSTRTSGQFKVLRNGFWSKVEFQKDEPEHDQREEYKIPLSNPWIQHYRNSKVQANKRCSASSAKLPLTMPMSNLPPSSEDFSDTKIEAIDQNFNDGVLEDEKATKIDEMKAVRSDDQVVPNGNIIHTVKDHVHKPPEDLNAMHFT